MTIEKPKANVSNKQIFLFIINNLKSFPAAKIIMVWTAIFWAVDLSVRPYLIKIMLNSISMPDNKNIFYKLFIPVLFYLIMYLTLTISYRLYHYFVEIKMVPQLRSKIASLAFAKITEQSHGFYANNFSGNIVNKIMDLTSSIPDLIGIVVGHFLSNFLALILAIITLWLANSYFAILMVIFSLILVTGTIFFSKHLSFLATIWSERSSQIAGQLVDVLSNILSLRLFSAKEKEKEALKETLTIATKAEQKLQWAYFLIWALYNCFFLLLQCLNFYFLITCLQNGLISIGDFALVLMINIAIMEFLRQLAEEFSRFSKLLGKIRQALNTILIVPEIKDQKNASALIVKNGIINFEQIHFFYQGNKPLFDSLTITINSHEKVGLVGYSGSGKTTLVNLLLRLYEPTSGRILIDNQDISLVSQDSLRANIGMIPQDPFLFHRSILENIRYGRHNASDAEVISASMKAHAHDFIVRLPQGYAALVGERGVKLSGGQRQRIALARAILKNAPIFILDEATSQLDSLTEKYIQESLRSLTQSKTTIIIAHRLSTLLHMDRILVFDQGHVIQDGSHKVLLNAPGLYKTLWNTQVGGFLPDNKL